MKNRKQSLLWKIDGEGLPGPSYVFGTMHVMDQRAFKYRESVYATIADCDLFATEFPLNEMGSFTGAEVLSLPDGMTLEDLMTPKKYLKLRKIFKKAAGIELNLFRHSLPIMVTNILTEQILSKDMPVSLDEHLWNYAQNLGKELTGIETFREQIDILQKIPLDYQLESLIGIGKNFKRYRKDLLKMANLYENGDLMQLHKKGKKGAQGLRRLLIHDRNEIMAGRIAGIASEKTVFCAIGAGHLAGKKGILRLLKLKGFKVRAKRL